MAGFGKSSRAGKRGSSSSSYASTFTMVVFVALCLLAVWMLTSSSIVPSHAATAKTTHLSRSSSSSSATTSSRSFLRDPPPAAMDDDPGELPEDPIKGDSQPGAEEEQDEDKPKSSGDGNRDSATHGVELASKSESKVGEEFEENQQQQQQHADEETPQIEQAGGNEEKGEHNLQQEEHDSDGTTDGGQLQEEKSVKQEQQADDDQLRSQEEQQIGSDGEGNQQESQEQQKESGGDEEQQSQEQQKESGGNEEQQSQEQQKESGSDEEHQQSQTETEESENQMQQQQTQTETEESENQMQQTEEGLSEESHSQSDQQTEEETNEKQPEQEQQTDASEDQQQQQQQMEDAGIEETQQQSEEKLSNPNAGDSLPDGVQSEVSNDGDGKKRAWATQADHSDSEKERRRDESQFDGGDNLSSDNNGYGYEWELCNVTAGPNYIPCLDNQKAIKKLHSLRHFEHRERHCPEESPTCLVPLPKGYKQPIEWPKSRDRIWYNNVPFTKLAEVKGHQNWVKVTGQYLTFPGGGTQFVHGALHYIDFLQQAVRDIAWGKRTRVILDVGCGVASFGGYLFDRDVLAMSFAPKDEHEAQIQFALERGIPAISAVMGSQRLQFPGRVFDIVHCARCRVPWHVDGGTLLLELNRVLRPGGYFVWSATPVYQKLKEDVEIWKAMTSLTKSMCWELVTIKKDKLNSVGAAIFRKPITNECYDNRKQDSPPMCKVDDDPNAAWYIPLQACMHRAPVDASERGSRWPEAWPRRAEVPPYWLNRSQIGVYGKPATEDFIADYEHWKRVVKKSYLSGLGISWSRVRNVMDMRAVYGGFAAALKDLKVWVMNVVNIDSPDTLPIIYERGLFGMYHDWCESFSTYPRTYDLLHADHLFSRLKKRCNIVPVMAEVDRIVRPGGKLIVRDESALVSEVENLLKSLHWEVRLTFSKAQEGILCAEKSDWRPEKYADSS